MSTITTVPVSLGARAYDILIGAGLLADAAVHIGPLLRQQRVFVVTDEQVAGHYLEPLRTALTAAGIAVEAIVLPAGEQTKDFAHLQTLTDRILAAGADRESTIVALGGGVIGDLAGFAAAIVLRGVDFIQVPTTLLAQVDSSVGGKTAINSAHGKNLIGSFHQPRLVLADTTLLDSLPAREIRAGYAEVAKYGLIDEPAFFAWLETNGTDLLAGDAAARAHAVAVCCAAKARVVAADEREGNRRALLNLGHTFGHALEVDIGYGGELLHGEAVAIGCVLAFALSVRMGLCPSADLARLRAHYQAVDLPIRIPSRQSGSWDPDRLIGHMAHDKKVRDGRLTFVLARGIGAAFLCRDVDLDRVRAIFADALP